MATPYARQLLGLDAPAAAPAAAAPPPAPTPAAAPAAAPNARRAPIQDRPSAYDPAPSQPLRYLPKSEATRALIAGAVHEHMLFSQLSASEISDVIGAMKRELVAASENVIAQGEEGDKFYVLEEGACDIVVGGATVGAYGPGAAFGELALMYNCPRAATILATATCTLWSLDRRTFRRILATTSSATMMARCEFLKQVRLLEPLSNEQISKLAGVLGSASFASGEYIIRQGDEGDVFYIIQEGQVKCTHRKSDSDPTETDLLTLGEGDYFGEMALLLQEPRHANCIALGDVTCYTLDRHHFDELLGPLRDLLDQQMRIRVLKSVPLLSSLSDNELDMVANAMHVQVFEEGDHIIRQGEEGDCFYIINEGEVVCCNMNDQGNMAELCRLSNQEFFGERALLKQEPRKAEVIAVGRVECLVLDRDSFTSLLGSLEDIMAREMARREAMQVEHQQQDEPAAPAEPQGPTYAFEELRQIRTIGTGTFGRVKIVQDQQSGRVMALKTMQKAQIVAQHQERNIAAEKTLMAECQHSFVLQLIQTFQNHDAVFMLLEIVPGGELWSLLYEKCDVVGRGPFGGFTEDASRFYAGCVTAALRYIHGRGIAYRDLKPENLLLDAEGFLKVVDFGFAKRVPFYKGAVLHHSTFTLCGTPEYLSPELVLSKGHDKGVDYWALGCLVYELIVGNTPFQDQAQPEIFRKIIHSQQALRFPPGFPAAAKDLVKKLLQPKPALRLGNLLNGADDIVNHAWFADAGFSFDALERRELTPPFVPTIRDPLDTSNFDPYPEDDTIAPYHGPQSHFEGF